MFARVSTYQGDAAQLRAGFEAVTPELETVDGFAGAYFLIGGPDGKAMSITLWDSTEALERSAQQANQLRSKATQPSGAEIQAVEGYEVALTAGAAAR